MSMKVFQLFVTTFACVLGVGALGLVAASQPTLEQRKTELLEKTIPYSMAAIIRRDTGAVEKFLGQLGPFIDDAYTQAEERYGQKKTASFLTRTDLNDYYGKIKDNLVAYNQLNRLENTMIPASAEAAEKRVADLEGRLKEFGGVRETVQNKLNEAWKPGKPKQIRIAFEVLAEVAKELFDRFDTEKIKSMIRAAMVKVAQGDERAAARVSMQVNGFINERYKRIDKKYREKGGLPTTLEELVGRLKKKSISSLEALNALHAMVIGELGNYGKIRETVKTREDVEGQQEKIAELVSRLTRIGGYVQSNINETCSFVWTRPSGDKQICAVFEVLSDLIDGIKFAIRRESEHVGMERRYVSEKDRSRAKLLAREKLHMLALLKDFAPYQLGTSGHAWSEKLIQYIEQYDTIDISGWSKDGIDRLVEFLEKFKGGNQWVRVLVCADNESVNDEVLQKLVAAFPNLEVLDLSRLFRKGYNIGLRSNAFFVITSLTNLKKLKVSQTDISDTALREILEKNKSLEWLDISGCKLLPPGTIKNLAANLVRLQYLFVYSLKTNTEDLRALIAEIKKAYPLRLRVLDISYLKTSAEDLRAIAEIQKMHPKLVVIKGA